MGHFAVAPVRANTGDDAHRRFFEQVAGRQLFARDTTAPGLELVFLERGQADAVRPRCKTGELQCPVEDCPAPRFTTSGGTRRDHFRHLPNTSVVHEAETLAHLTAKNLIGRWARSANPALTVEVDQVVLPNGRKPDVLITGVTGHKVAVEVQYSPLTVEEWRARHAGYVRLGITDVWLWGHVPRYCKQAPKLYASGPADVTLVAVTRAAAAAGLPLLWINPFEELIGTGLLSWQETQLLADDDSASEVRTATLQVESLESCRLEREGVLTPALYGQLARHAGEAARAARRARQEEERRRQREARRQRWIDEQQRRQHEAWRIRREQLLGAGQKPPAVASAGSAKQFDFRAHPEHWKTELLHGFDDRLGLVIAFDDLVAEVAAKFRRPVAFVAEAVSAFLFVARKHGYVWFNNHGLSIGSGILVLGSLRHRPPPDVVAACQREGAVRLSLTNGVEVQGANGPLWRIEGGRWVPAVRPGSGPRPAVDLPGNDPGSPPSAAERLQPAKP
ncbi:MAG: competence protein CoiA [Actinomycetales bacterium]